MIGQPTTIVVDDILAFKPNSTKLVFDKVSSTNGLWAVFLEKAWAKLNGNYEQANFGNANEVFQFLLGLPSVMYERGITSNW